MEFFENPPLNKILQPGDIVYLEIYYTPTNKMLFKTSIREIIEKQILLNVERNDNVISQIQPGVKMVLYFKKPNRSNDYVFFAKFIRFEPEKSCLIIERKDQITLGRKYFRCDVQLPFSCFSTYEIIGEALNLSISGLYADIRFDEKILIGTILNCKLTLPTESKPIKFTGKVTRLHKHEPRLGVGIKFFSIGTESLNQINRYLFKRQQELIIQKKFRVVR